MYQHVEVVMMFVLTAHAESICPVYDGISACVTVDSVAETMNNILKTLIVVLFLTELVLIYCLAQVEIFTGVFFVVEHVGALSSCLQLFIGARPGFQ